MRHDIDWETACNDFHPAFRLVRGERLDRRRVETLDAPIMTLTASYRGRPVLAHLLPAAEPKARNRRTSIRPVLETV